MKERTSTRLPGAPAIAVLAAIAIVLTGVFPGAGALLARADAANGVRGPIAHLTAELDRSKAGKTAAVTPFTLFAQSQAEPVDTGHSMGVKHTYVDESFAEGYTSLDDIAADGHIAEAIVGQYESVVSLYDFGSDEYLAAFVDTTRENGGSDLPLEATFAKWDTSGTVYDFVEYDAETGIAYVPKSFYHDENGTEVARSIQCQLVHAYSFSGEQVASVSVNAKSDDETLHVTSGIVTSDIADPTISIELVDPDDADRVSLSGITVRAEDSEEPIELVDGVNAVYDNTTGVLTLASAPIASTVYDITVTPDADEGISTMSAGDITTMSTDAASLTAWPWGKITNWSDCKSNFVEGKSVQYNWWTRYMNDPSTWDSENPSSAYPKMSDYIAAVLNSGSAYAFLDNTNGNHNAGSTAWLIERLLDGTSWAEVSSHDLQNIPASALAAGEAWFTFGGPAQSSIGVTGLGDPIDPTGAGSACTLIGYCGHVSSAAGGGMNSDGAASYPVVMRTLKVDESAGYVICGFVTAGVTTQAGVGVYKFRIDDPYGTIELNKTSADDSKTSGNDNYRLDATYGLYSNAACTDKVGTFNLDASGHASMSGVRAGNYWIKEIAASKGYKLDTTAHPVTVTAGRTTTANVTEEPELGSIAISKVSSNPSATNGNSNYTMRGIRYYVYTDAGCTKRASGIGAITLDADGRGSVDGVPFGSYWVKEDATSVSGTNYKANAKAYPVTVSSSTKAAEPAENPSDEPELGSIEIDKVSSNPGATDGNSNYTMRGIRYYVYTDAACTNRATGVGAITLDEKGHGSVGNVPFGSYWVKEDAASISGTNYKANAKAYPVTVSDSSKAAKPAETPKDEPRLGQIAIQKRSTASNISDSNRCYDFTGIRYLVYTDSACTKLASGIGNLTLDKDGKASVGNVPFGTYWVREDATSLEGSGFAYNDKAYPVDVTTDASASTPVETVADEPLNDPIDILVSKVDAMTGKPSGSGPEPLSGARFELSYWDVRNGDGTGTPTRKWTFATDGSGRIHANDASYKVAGDELYRDEFGDVAYPIGTYSIVEVEPAASYLLPEDNKPYVFHVTDKFTSHDYAVSNDLDAAGRKVHESPIRHDLSFVKVDEKTQSRMAGVPFLASLVNAEGEVLERHVIVTDANGRYDSTAYRHSMKTNASDAALVENPDGSFSVDESKLVADSGLWFGIGEDGSYTAPVDSKGAIPDSSTCVIVIEELRASTNEGRDLVKFPVSPTGADGSRIDLGTVTDKTPDTPDIGTNALDAADGDRTVSREPDARVRDMVTMIGLETGREYTIVGTIVDRASGEAIVDDFGNPYMGKTTFTAGATFTSRYVDIEFDATRVADGAEIVVFERLLEGNEVVSVHTDVDDVAQMLVVTAPKVGTTAVDGIDADKAVMRDSTVTIIDTVTYDGLLPGATYTVEGTLMDRATGEPVRDASGHAVTSTVELVPQDRTGSVEVTFEFDASSIADGTEIVAFERLVRMDREIASHEDLQDDFQTVTLVEPKIGTTAVDSVWEGHVIEPFDTVKIVDTVAYEGLAVGLEYTVEGTLMDAATGSAVMSGGHPVTASATFVAEASSGSVEVTFEFDATALAGHDLVAFERLLLDSRLIASHEDIEDEDQTVHVTDPEIGTTAVDGLDGDKLVSTDGHAITIVDTVSYEGLVAGHEYEVTGVLMDKATGMPYLDATGAQVTASTTFIAETESGSVEVAFSFDAGETGLDLVAFEALYAKGMYVTSHEDIDDADQTVTLVPPTIGTTAVDAADGDKTVYADGVVKIVDTVSYEGLVAGHSYTVEGVLMDKSTGEALRDATGHEVTASATFVAEASSGSVEVTFEFDATALSGPAVAFEQVSANGRIVASHEDIDDEDQTVTIVPPTIGTTAVDAADGDHVAMTGSGVVIVDKIAYEGLAVGVSHVAEGVLMDKSTGKPYLDANGREVRSSATFVPEEANGSVEVRFAFDAGDGDAGTRLVAFEQVMVAGRVVASHEDIDDEDQTVELGSPRIGTVLVDAEDGDHVVDPAESVTLVDTVSYEGLSAGRTYVVIGVLMDKESAEPLFVDGSFVTSESTFVAEASSGTVEVTFEFDATALAGHDLVAFETLLTTDAQIVADHSDIDDEAQTVSVAEVPGTAKRTPFSKTGVMSAALLALPLLGIGLGLALMGIGMRRRDLE